MVAAARTSLTSCCPVPTQIPPDVNVVRRGNVGDRENEKSGTKFPEEADDRKF